MKQKITVEIVNPEALGQASINLTKAVAKMFLKQEEENENKKIRKAVS